MHVQVDPTACIICVLLRAAVQFYFEYTVINSGDPITLLLPNTLFVCIVSAAYASPPKKRYPTRCTTNERMHILGISHIYIYMIAPNLPLSVQRRLSVVLSWCYAAVYLLDCFSFHVMVSSSFRSNEKVAGFGAPRHGTERTDSRKRTPRQR